MFFNLSTQQAFLCHPSRETVFVIAHLGNFVLFQKMLQHNFVCRGELHQADKHADWDTTGHRFIPEEKVEQDQIIMAAQRYLRLQGTRTSCRVKPVTVSSWAGNSQQTTALIKCTLFPAAEKLLKLLEVPYLLLVIINWALYAEDQWKNCASVKCPEALETENVTAFKVLQRLWGPCHCMNSTYFWSLAFCSKENKAELSLSPVSKGLAKGKHHAEYRSKSLGDTNCVIAFCIKIKGHLCLSLACTDHVGTLRYPKRVPSYSRANVSVSVVSTFPDHTAVPTPWLPVWLHSRTSKLQALQEQLTHGYGFSSRQSGSPHHHSNCMLLH